MNARDLTSDLPGRRFATAGPTRHGMAQRVSVKEEKAVEFARELAHYLEDCRTREQFYRLYVAAAPKFLGHLRDEMEPATRATVRHAYDKNWTHERPERIRTHLPEWL